MCLGIYMYLCNPELPISENSLTSKPSIMQVFQGCQCTGIQCFSDSLKFEAVTNRFSWTSSNCLVKSELIIYPNINIPSGIKAIQNRHQVTPPHWDSTLNPHLKPRNSNAEIVDCFGRPNTSYHQRFPNFFFEKGYILYTWLRLTIRSFIYNIKPHRFSWRWRKNPLEKSHWKLHINASFPEDFLVLFVLNITFDATWCHHTIPPYPLPSPHLDLVLPPSGDLTATPVGEGSTWTNKTQKTIMVVWTIGLSIIILYILNMN